MVAALFRAQLHRHHVGTGVGLAHGQGADVLAADQLGQVLGLLFGVAVALDLVDAEVGVGAVGEGDRSRTTADLLHGDHVGQVAQTRAAVFLFDGDAEQAHVAEFLPHVHREEVVRVDLRGARRQFSGDEVAHLVAQHVDGFAEAEVEGRIAHGCTFFLVFGVRGQEATLAFSSVSAMAARQRSSAVSSSSCICWMSRSCWSSCSRRSEIFCMKVSSCLRLPLEGS
ncbi:hypothetical protein D3C81_1051190 [compost metagenome]